MTAPTSDDLRQLREALRGSLGTAKEDAPPSVSEAWRTGWPGLADLGVTAFCVPEASGGLGFEVGAAVVTADELGAALHGSPYAALTAAAVVLASLDDAEAADLLAALVSGQCVVAYGVYDAELGRAPNVDGAPDADALLLEDRAAGDLVLVTDSDAWRVARSGSPFDVSRTAGDVTVDLARGWRVPASPAARQVHRLLLAADALGCVRRALDVTVRYAGQRVAFGKPIGAFQAVQHRLADHAVRARGMSLLVAEAARAVAAERADAERAVLLAELGVTGSAPHLLHDLLQLTGGIGFTWEYGLHFFERRVHQDARLAANPRAAARALSAVEGWTR